MKNTKKTPATAPQPGYTVCTANCSITKHSHCGSMICCPHRYTADGQLKTGRKGDADEPHDY